MNICKKAQSIEIEYIVGNLYSWKETPDRINILASDVDEKHIYMIRLDTGKKVCTNPQSEFNKGKYVDVTAQYCLQKVVV